MNKLFILLAAFATLAGNSAFAQPTGRGAAASKNNGSDNFQWGIAVGTAAVVGTVIGLTVATASSKPVTFSTKGS